MPARAPPPRFEFARELGDDVEPAGFRGAGERAREGGLYSVMTERRPWGLVR